MDNSFHVFIRQAMFFSSLIDRCSLAFAVSLRALGQLTGGHEGMKKRVLRWYSGISEENQQEITNSTLRSLQKTVSFPVISILEDLKAKGAILVLATAAPDFYARPISSYYGFRDCLASESSPTSKWVELLKERKATACEAWLMKHSAGATTSEKFHIISITDHMDDLPLLAISNEVILHANTGTWQEIRNQLKRLRKAPILRILDPEVEEMNGGFWLWYDDRPMGPMNKWELHTTLSKHRHAALYVGRGEWKRIQPGEDITSAIIRRTCPIPPSTMKRLMLKTNRYLMRDVLGIYH